MAKGVTILHIIHPSEDFRLPGGNLRSRNFAALDTILNGILGGAYGVNGTSVMLGQSTGVKASGTLTLSGASGTVGGNINGVAVTVTASGGDTATAAALAAAINASVNPLVAGIVTASSALGVVTITAVQYGLTGNSITLSASGTGVTQSGARLAGGVSTGMTTLVR